MSEETLTIMTMTLGMTMTNTYVVADPLSKEAVVVDPGDEGEKIVDAVQARGLEIKAIWLTHSHFDHILGVSGMASALGGAVPLALHPDERPLWDARGGASLFGQPEVDPGMQPSIDLSANPDLMVGRYAFTARHTPGHTLGHVVYVCHEAHLAIVGDLVFQASVGRTDLPGGDWDTLLHSIKHEILALDDDYQLFPGHGPSTTVGAERISNPFLATKESEPTTFR